MAGPDDPRLYRVLTVVADRIFDADGVARITSATVAERARLSRWYARQLLACAVADGWLDIATPGSRRRATSYRLGPLLADASADTANNPDGELSTDGASPVQNRHLMARGPHESATHVFNGINSAVCAACQDIGWVFVDKNTVARCVCVNNRLRGKIAGRSLGPCAETPDAAPTTADPRSIPRRGDPNPPGTSATTPTNEPAGSPSSAPRSARHAKTTITWDRPQARSPSAG
jgi:hypothetical protein